MLFVSLLIKKNKITWKKYDRVGSEMEREVGVSTLINTTSKCRQDIIALSVITQLIELRIWYLAKQFVNCQMNYFES